MINDGIKECIFILDMDRCLKWVPAGFLRFLCLWGEGMLEVLWKQEFWFALVGLQVKMEK